MSFLDEKTLDIVLEENTNFGYRLTFIEVDEDCQAHPVTGELINCIEVEKDIDITLLNFTGGISESLDAPVILQDFTFSKINPTKGVIDMTLNKTAVTTLSALGESKRNIKNPRYRFLGYYDVNAEDAGTGTTTRVMQGEVYISDGVTA